MDENLRMKRRNKAANKKVNADHFYLMINGISEQILTTLSRRRNELATLCSHLKKCKSIFLCMWNWFKIRHCTFLNIEIYSGHAHSN